MKRRPKRWIQKAIKHPGAFTAQAKRAGMDVQQFAREVANHPSRFTLRTRRRAVLALRLAKMGRKRRRMSLHTRTK